MIIDFKLSTGTFHESIRHLLNRIHLDQQVKQKADTIVPKVCSDWVNSHLSKHVAEQTNIYMNKHFSNMFTREMTYNPAVTVFINKHLKSVEDQVKQTAQIAVNEIVNNERKFKPIFESYTSILSDRTKNLVLNLRSYSSRLRHSFSFLVSSAY